MNQSLLAVLYSCKAVANWSGQDVDLNPHLIPLSLSITWSTVIPTTSFDIPCVLPAQPPKNLTLLTLPSIMSR